MDDESGIFNIEISDVSSDEAESKAARRTGQTEEAWNKIKNEYKAKVENGNVYQSVQLPLTADASKSDIQQAVHAVEELYFFRRFQEAAQFALRVLQDSEGLDEETRQLLVQYHDKCQKRHQAQLPANQDS